MGIEIFSSSPDTGESGCGLRADGDRGLRFAKRKKDPLDLIELGRDPGPGSPLEECNDIEELFAFT